MRWMIGSSVRLAVVLLVAVGLILGVGVYELTRAPVDTLPELLPPRVQVHTDAVGLSSQEAEQFLTVPAEYELATVAFLDSLKSRSVPGLSSITLTFKRDISVWTARQLVSERMAQVPLPVDVGTPPVMIQPLSSAPRAMMIGLSSNTINPIDLTTLAKWRIRPRLLAVPGVANVVMWGQRDREMLVLVEPTKMAKHGVTLDQVLATVGDSMWTSPLTFVPASSPGADGLIDMPSQRLTIQHILPIITSKDLVNVPIEGTGPKPVLVGDISTVVEDHSLLTGDAVVRRGQGLILVIEKLPGADAVSVDRGVEAAMAELSPGLGGITVDTGLYRPSTFLTDSLRSVGVAGLVALLLASAWLGWAYRSWRVALTSAVSIVGSLIAASLVLYAMGQTFNALTAAGLVMALGVLVQDAVAGADALLRRREEAAASDQPLAWTDLVAEAFADRRGPVGFLLVSLALVAVPLLVVAGVAGTLSWQMGIAYLLALLASAVVSATVAPALTVLLARGTPAGGAAPRGARVGVVERAVHAVASWPGAVALGVAVVVLASAVVGWYSVPKSYVPSLRDGNLVVHWQAVSGTSLAEMRLVTTSAENKIAAVAGVRSVTTNIGRALSGDQLVGSDAAETWIALDSSADYGATLSAVRSVLAGFPGYAHTVASYSDQALADARTDGGPDLTVRLYGSSAQTMTATAEKIRAAVTEIPGAANVTVGTTTEQPLIQVETDIGKAAKYGLKPGDIRRQAAALIGGIPVGSYYKDQQVFDVTVWGSPSLRRTPGDIEELPIFAADGTKIPLKAVAAVSLKPTPAIVDHEKASRFLDITAHITGADPGVVTAAAQNAVSQMQLPVGYHIEVTSALRDRRAAALEVMLVALAVAVGVYLLLQAALSSWRRASLLALGLPLSATGCVLVGAIFGWGLSLGVVAAIVTVLGVALRDSTVLIGRFHEAGEAAHARGETHILAEVTATGAMPVVATAVGLALLVVPFLVLPNVSGIELLRPFAAAVLGGLVTSTLLSLLVVPALYRRWGIQPHVHAQVEGAQS